MKGKNADLPAHEVFDSLRSQRHRNRQTRGLPHMVTFLSRTRIRLIAEFLQLALQCELKLLQVAFGWFVAFFGGADAQPSGFVKEPCG